MGRYWKRQKTLIVAYVEVHILHLFLPKRISVLFHSLPFYYAAKYLRESWPWVAIIPSLYHSNTGTKMSMQLNFDQTHLRGNLLGDSERSSLSFMREYWKLLFSSLGCGHLLLWCLYLLKLFCSILRSGTELRKLLENPTRTTG